MKALTLILQLLSFLITAAVTRNREKKDEEIKNDPTGAWESKFGKLQQPTDADSVSEVRSSSDSSGEDKRRDKDS